ncbi:MAG TPA: four-carbon acid sugar kinase family protein [Azospirillum sp.]|nr:four-carbon acid sugar kinase family protein [Azospirillum sp.]
MPEILIIADDLSGAADSGNSLVAAGLDTLVVLDSRGNLPDAAALSLDLDTRRLPAEPAAALHVDAVRRLRSPDTALYKKIDSTLRGNWAVETAAVHIALAGNGHTLPMAMVAPAFPAAGRVTRRGRMYVNGTPLDETEIWRHEGLTGPADLRALLRAAGLQTELADLNLIRRGDAVLREALREWLDDGVEALACDAETDADLATLARVTTSLRERVFWVGSAGFAYHLPGALGLMRAGALPDTAMPTPLDPVLIVVGSSSGVSQVQAERLMESGAVRGMAIDPHVLRIGPGTTEWGHAEQELREVLASGDDVLLTMATGPALDRRDGHALAVALGRLVHEQAPRIGGLVITGGETARAVLAALGIGAIRLLGEVEPGVPLGIAQGDRPMPLITKAGAFGSPDTLVRCRQRLRAQALPPVAEAGTGRAAPHAPHHPGSH